MSKPQSVYMWEDVDTIIHRIESQIDLIPKTTYIYESQYFPKDNEDCSLKYYNI